MKTAKVVINKRQYLELEKISIGAFTPLTGFMKKDEFFSVVNDLHLLDGSLFPIPVVLDLNKEQASLCEKMEKLILVYGETEVGSVKPESIFTCDKKSVARKVFGTEDEAHPGVKHFYCMGDYFVGGEVQLYAKVKFDFSEYEFTPQETKSYFKEKGWETIVGFQTRNVPHRAHEYLQRLGLELVDGLFIQPLVGRKKSGDYTPQAILTGYNILIKNFMPANRVLLGILSTSMRYAGPREALFHAIIRRNYGCTHFIIGRDHAGVGNYYGKYDAHKLAHEHEKELGISILYFSGPFYCRRCDGIVTERTCPHIESHPEAVRHISGSDVREILMNEENCPRELMRPEVVHGITGNEVFITEDED
jgi:sulfate adenylyltransferase